MLTTLSYYFGVVVVGNTKSLSNSNNGSSSNKDCNVVGKKRFASEVERLCLVVHYSCLLPLPAHMIVFGFGFGVVVAVVVVVVVVGVAIVAIVEKDSCTTVHRN